MKGVAIQYNSSSSGGDILDIKKNIALDSDGKVVSGFSFGPVTEQNQAIILIAAPGEFKQLPTLGVGFFDQILSDDLLQTRHNIREQFKRDKLKIEKLEVYDLSRVQIKAHY